MSYLNQLRLHFAGKFQAAPSTVNNDPTHYDNVNFKPEYQQEPWNPRGDADWRLIGCRVTSAWYVDGRQAGADDLILTCLIADSDRRVAAKLVDLDTQQQLVSAIWGLEVRICDMHGETLLRGQFETASFIDLWQRAARGGGDTGDFLLGAMYQSILSNLEWGKFERSPFLTELRQTARDGLLSIKFNVDGYTMNFNSPEFTRGRIVGTIGPAAVGEPRHFLRGRQFMTDPQGKINFCTAVVNQDAGKILLDLGNALPTTQPGGPLENQGELAMVCEVQPHGNPVQPLPLGSIPYTENGWYERTAGIVELPADRRLTGEELNAIATNPLALLLPGPDNRPALAIAEAPGGLYARADQFVFRLNPGDQAEVRLFATRFGQPYAGTHILLNSDPGQLQADPAQIAIPANVVEYPSEVITGEDGVATILIRAHDPGNPRGYIDGQIKGIRPTLKEVAGGNYPVNQWNFISLLILDDFHADEPPTWWGSLQPIFQQYANLYPVMSRFLNLADYVSVCENRELLLFAFGLEAENPNAMPVTRDLSAAKRKAILRWLKETGQDGKPRLGTPHPAQVALEAKAALAPSPSTQAASQESLKGGKTAAMNRRLALRSSGGQS